MELNEQILRIKQMMLLDEDASSTTTTSTGSVWDSGVKRGKGNPVGNTKWESGITRGPGNPLNEDDKLESFAEIRLGGAEKIADNAKEKGGAALLTYHHLRLSWNTTKKPPKVS